MTSAVGAAFERFTPKNDTSVLAVSGPAAWVRTGESASAAC